MMGLALAWVYRRALANLVGRGGAAAGRRAADECGQGAGAVAGQCSRGGWRGVRRPLSLPPRERFTLHLHVDTCGNWYGFAMVGRSHRCPEAPAGACQGEP